jgi:hypothetical protein
MPEMVFHESGEIALDTDRAVLIDPSLKDDVYEMSAFIPTRLFRFFRLPIEGEIGWIGNCRLVLSGDTSAIKDKWALRRLIWGARPCHR